MLFRSGDGVEHARAAAFAILVLCQMFVVRGMQESDRPLSPLRALADLRLFGVVAASLAIQAAIHQVPALQRVFGTSAVTAAQLAAWIGLALVPLAVLEIAKIARPGRTARP